MKKVAITMIGGFDREGIVIPYRRISNKKLNEIAHRQYFLEKIYEAGGPVEFDGDRYVLNGEINISQEFLSQDVTITWKKETSNG